MRKGKGIRRARFVYLGILLVIVILGFAYLQRPGPATPPVESTIVAVGDSWVEGVGASSGKDFVSLLSDRLDVPIVNAGKTGDTTADVLARLDSDVLVHDPTLVILMVGGNDVFRLVPRTTTQENLAEIILRLESSGAEVLLVGFRCGITTDECAQMFTTIAEEYRLVLVPAIQDGVIGHPNLMSDPLHPNNAGYVRVADKIEPALRELLE